jgi:hypothetical protein
MLPSLCGTAEAACRGARRPPPGQDVQHGPQGDRRAARRERGGVYRYWEETIERGVDEAIKHAKKELKKDARADAREMERAVDAM